MGLQRGGQRGAGRAGSQRWAEGCTAFVTPACAIASVHFTDAETKPQRVPDTCRLPLRARPSGPSALFPGRTLPNMKPICKQVFSAAGERHRPRGY